MFDASGARRKIVIFTEHRDTLDYLTERLRTLIGKPEAVVTIQGGMNRETRKATEHAFKNDPRSRSSSPPMPPAKASTSSAPT